MRHDVALSASRGHRKAYDSTNLFFLISMNDFEFRPMRRKNQALPLEECTDILHNATSGTLALLGDGGYPYSLPISYVYEATDNLGKLYFHSALHGHKVDAIAGCDKASFSIIDKDDVHAAEYTTYYRSVICFGRIRIITDEKEKDHALRLLGNRYYPNQDAELDKELLKAARACCAIELTIEHLSGKQSKYLVNK